MPTPMEGLFDEGSGIKVTANFLGQVEMHRVGKLYLGLEQAVLFLETPAEVLIDVSRQAIQWADDIIRGQVISGASANKTIAARGLQIVTSIQTVGRSAESLLNSLQGVERIPGRAKRWVDEMTLGLGRFHDLKETSSKHEKANPNEADVQITAAPHLTHLRSLNQSLHTTFKKLRIATLREYDEAEALISTFITQMDALASENDRATTSLKTILATGKMTSDFIPAQTINSAFQQLQSSASKRGWTTLIQEAHQLLQVPVRVARDSSRIHIWMEAPIIPATEPPFEVLKAAPAMLRSENGHLLQLRAKTMVMVRGREVIPISDQQLEETCVTQGGYLACTRGLTHQRRTSCEGELLGNDIAAGTIQCQQGLQVLDPFEEHLSQVGPNSFDWYSPSPSIVRMECPGDRHTEAELQGLCRMDLEKGCRAISPKNILDPAEGSSRGQEEFSWTVPPIRIAEVLRSIQIPEPEEWDDLAKSLHVLSHEEGGPSVNDLIESLPKSSLLPRTWAALPEDIQTLWILLLTLLIAMGLLSHIVWAHRHRISEINRRIRNSNCCNCQRHQRTTSGVRTLVIPEGHELEAWIVKSNRQQGTQDDPPEEERIIPILSAEEPQGPI